MHASLAAEDGVADDLLEALSDPDPRSREFALSAIGKSAGEEVALLILEALNDPEPAVRCAAAAAAGRSDALTAVFTLILLLDDPMPEVAQEAKVAIEQITGRKVGLGPTQSASARTKKIKTLKDWWKKERFARLAAEIETVLKT